MVNRYVGRCLFYLYLWKYKSNNELLVFICLIDKIFKKWEDLIGEDLGISIVFIVNEICGFCVFFLF